jgi:hypothetical protein
MMTERVDWSAMSASLDNPSYVKAYKEFMGDIRNEYNCGCCPENRDALLGTEFQACGQLACGQQRCWVTCHDR